MDNQLLQIQNRSCRIYGDTGAEYLLLQMANEHDFAGMAREVEAIHRQTAQPFFLRKAIGYEMRRKQKARLWYLMGQVEALQGHTQNAYGAFKDVYKRQTSIRIIRRGCVRSL